MKRVLILSLVLILALVSVPGWSQTKEAAQEKVTQPVLKEKAPQMSHETMSNMQEMMQEMQQMLGQEKIVPEQRKKMQEMMGKMQGMMTQMHEKKPLAMGKMDMCPMMQKMDDQAKKIKALEERLDNLEKAKGKSK